MSICTITQAVEAITGWIGGIGGMETGHHGTSIGSAAGSDCTWIMNLIPETRKSGGLIPQAAMTGGMEIETGTETEIETATESGTEIETRIEVGSDELAVGAD